MERLLEILKFIFESLLQGLRPQMHPYLVALSPYWWKTGGGKYIKRMMEHFFELENPPQMLYLADRPLLCFLNAPTSNWDCTMMELGDHISYAVPVSHGRTGFGKLKNLPVGRQSVLSKFQELVRTDAEHTWKGDVNTKQALSAMNSMVLDKACVDILRTEGLVTAPVRERSNTVDEDLMDSERRAREAKENYFLYPLWADGARVESDLSDSSDADLRHVPEVSSTDVSESGASESSEFDEAALSSGDDSSSSSSSSSSSDSSEDEARVKMKKAPTRQSDADTGSDFSEEEDSEAAPVKPTSPSQLRKAAQAAKAAAREKEKKQKQQQQNKLNAAREKWNEEHKKRRAERNATRAERKAARQERLEVAHQVKEKARADRLARIARNLQEAQKRAADRKAHHLEIQQDRARYDAKYPDSKATRLRIPKAALYNCSTLLFEPQNVSQLLLDVWNSVQASFERSQLQSTIIVCGALDEMYGPKLSEKVTRYLTDHKIHVLSQSEAQAKEKQKASAIVGDSDDGGLFSMGKRSSRVSIQTANSGTVVLRSPKNAAWLGGSVLANVPGFALGMCVAISSYEKDKNQAFNKMFDR
jgi:hypothetical protein